MPGTMAKLIRPTGFEDEQEKAKHEQDIADLLLQRSGQTQNIGSWAQVAAAIANGIAAHVVNKRASHLNDDVNSKMLAAANAADTGFKADVKAGLTPAQLVDKYSNNPWETDNLKPYQDAMSAALKKHAENGETLVNTPDKGYQPLTSEVGRVPFDPNKTVYSPDNGKTWMVNGVKVTADRLAQANGPPITAQTSMPAPNGQIPALPPSPTPAPSSYYPGNQAPGFVPSNIAKIESGGHDFHPDGSPVISKKGAMYGMQVLPSTAARPGYGVTPVDPAILALPASDPRRAAAFDRLGTDYAAAMQRKFGNPEMAAAAYNGGPGRMEAVGTVANMPSESQVYASHFAPPAAQTAPSPTPKAPDGVVNGKPYWLVNGVPFDNPQGN